MEVVGPKCAEDVGPTDGIERLAPAREYPVLCVDDERDNLLVFKAAFGDEFTVLLAQSAAEALELMEHESIAVLVADQRMPHVSGIELCHLVSERVPAVRRILLTAYSDHETAIRAINRGGVHGYLEKPWDPLAVRRVLWDAVNRVHLDRLVADLRAALAQRDERLEHARTLERIVHDMSNVAMRLSVTKRVLGRILDTHADSLPTGVWAQLTREANLLARAVEHLGRLKDERATGLGASAARPETLRIDEVLRTVVALSALPPSERLRLTVDTPPRLCAHADRLGVTRILVNLVTNARQSIEEGPEGEGEVRIAVRDEGAQWCSRFPTLAQESRPRSTSESSMSSSPPGRAREAPGWGLRVHVSLPEPPVGTSSCQSLSRSVEHFSA